jgi:hypothetical protein
MDSLFKLLFNLIPPLLLLVPECDPIHSLLISYFNLDSPDPRLLFFRFKFLHPYLLDLFLYLLLYTILDPLRFDLISPVFIRDDCGLGQFEFGHARVRLALLPLQCQDAALKQLDLLLLLPYLRTYPVHLKSTAAVSVSGRNEVHGGESASLEGTAAILGSVEAES